MSSSAPTKDHLYCTPGEFLRAERLTDTEHECLAGFAPFIRLDVPVAQTPVALTTDRRNHDQLRQKEFTPGQHGTVKLPEIGCSPAVRGNDERLPFAT